MFSFLLVLSVRYSVVVFLKVSRLVRVQKGVRGVVSIQASSI